MSALEQIAEDVIGILVKAIADRVESAADQQLTEQMVAEKLKLRADAQRMLDARKAGA